MTRFYGRAPQGKRLVDKVPHGHWKTTTFICGLRYDGVTAPFVLDGPMDGPHFLAYVEQILAPTLKKGQIVFLDNVSTHKVDGVEEAIAARGALAIFLRPRRPYAWKHCPERRSDPSSKLEQGSVRHRPGSGVRPSGHPAQTGR